MIRIPFLLLFVLSTLAVKAQETPAKREPVAGLAFGVFAHSYGFGFNLQAIKVRSRTNMILDLSLASLKHPRELKIESAYVDQGGKDYIYDKANYAYVLAPTFSLSKAIIPKSGYNKVSISGAFGAGPLLAILKPYYVEVAVPFSGNQAYRKSFRYDPATHNYTNIVGEADYFLGMRELSLVPGLRAKASAIVDFSASKEYIRGVELGAYADLYAKAPQIMGASVNRGYYIGGSVGVLVGNMW